MDTFVGRVDGLSTTRHRLRAGGLLTLMGTHGIGKTRLAVEAMEAWPGPARFCDLGDAGYKADLVRIVGDAVGRPAIGAALRPAGCVLVVLDGVDGVGRWAADTVGRWMAEAPQAGFLATSRDVLGVDTEPVLAVPPLPAEEGLAMLEARLEEAGRPLDEAERPLAVALVGVVGSIPLALELAARRVEGRGLEEVLAELGGRFDALERRGGRRTRGAIMEIVTDWACGGLGGDDCAALVRCARLGARFPSADAAAVAGGVEALRPLFAAGLLRSLEGFQIGVHVSVLDWVALRVPART